MCFPESSEFQRAPVEPKGGWRYVRRAKARCIIWTQIRKIVTFSVFHKSKKIEHCNCLFEFWSQNKFHTLILKNVSSKRRGFNRACAGGGGLKTNTRVHQIWGGACLKSFFIYFVTIILFRTTVRDLRPVGPLFMRSLLNRSQMTSNIVSRMRSGTQAACCHWCS